MKGWINNVPEQVISWGPAAGMLNCKVHRNEPSGMAGGIFDMVVCTDVCNYHILCILYRAGKIAGHVPSQ